MPVTSVAALVLAAAATVGAPAAQQPPSPPASPAAGGGGAAAAPFDPSTLPAVVARVNGRDITREELVSEAKGAYAQLRRMGHDPAVDATFFRSALDQRIASILLAADASERGLGATDEEIAQRFAAIRAGSDSDEAFRRSLEAQGLTEAAARAEIAIELARDHYIEKMILPQVQIDDVELRRFYDQNLESMRQPERVKVRHILIDVPDGADEETRSQARRRADEVMAKLRSGEDFAAVAEASSDDPTAAQGGELPWLRRGQVQPAFEQAAFALAPGSTSEVVASPLGFHIIQSIAHEPERTAAFDEVKDRILVLLQSQRTQERLRQIVDGLMAEAAIERFAL